MNSQQGVFQEQLKQIRFTAEQDIKLRQMQQEQLTNLRQENANYKLPSMPMQV
jgi:hypothetical protein